MNHEVPLFSEQLADSLRLGDTRSPEITFTATLHGIAAAVTEYGRAGSVRYRR